MKAGILCKQLLALCWVLLNFEDVCGKNVQGVAINGTLMIAYTLPSIGWAVGPKIGSAMPLAIKEVEKRQILPQYKVSNLSKQSHIDC